MAGSLGWLPRYSIWPEQCFQSKQMEYKCISVEHRTHCLFLSSIKAQDLYVCPCPVPGSFCCCCFESTYFDLWASKLFYFPSDAQEGLPPKCGLIALISSLCSPSTGAGVREFYKFYNVLLETWTFGLPLGMFLKIKFY